MDWDRIMKLQEGERVALKGFLYQSAGGEWVLSRESSLKSCCVGSIHKQKSQVFLPGDFSNCSAHKAQAIKGTWHIQANGSYSLSEPQVIQSGTFPFWTLGLLLAFAVLFKLRRLLLP